jgi:ABC-type Na+ efflux pump permease subunit
LFAGPIIAREVLTAPRPIRFYVARASYIALLFIGMWTAWQVLIGWREVTEFGIIARFGTVLFRIFAPLQLTLMLFFAPLAAATAIAHEKDRRTFVLLLMTDLRDMEIILGKLVASLLLIGTLLATGAPVFFLCMLLGGVAPAQIVDVLGVTAAAGLAGGALGLLVALWRDRTFQSLALTVLLMVLSLVAVEVIGFVRPDFRVLDVPFTAALNPFRAIMEVINPGHGSAAEMARPSLVFIGASLGTTALLLAFGIWKLRVWNPGRNEPREQREGEGEVEFVETLIEVGEEAEGAEVAVTSVAMTATSGPAFEAGRPTAERAARAVASGGSGPGGEPGPTTGLHVPRRTHRRIVKAPSVYRVPWDNPILWRELKTRAYGTKPLIIKGAYVLIFALGVAIFQSIGGSLENPLDSLLAMIPVMLAILSLIIVNAQGVTALTSERDTGALDLLLVTELSPGEFIYGKLYGVLYNTKEMIVLPVALTVWFTIAGYFSVEQTVYAIVDFLLLCHFSAMLGLHSAITYTNSRTAVANSLGTIFFLMVGILFCAYLIVLSNREFGRQMLSFLIFIGAGSVALFGSLGARNPSRAIAIVAALTPFWSFYCIISLLNHDFLAAFLVSVGIYGFALLAMLVPAVSDFDIALGRTNAIQG